MSGLNALKPDTLSLTRLAHSSGYWDALGDFRKAADLFLSAETKRWSWAAPNSETECQGSPKPHAGQQFKRELGPGKDRAGVGFVYPPVNLELSSALLGVRPGEDSLGGVVEGDRQDLIPTAATKKPETLKSENFAFCYIFVLIPTKHTGMEVCFQICCEQQRRVAFAFVLAAFTRNFDVIFWL